MTALAAGALRAVRNLDGKKQEHYTVGTAATLYQGALVCVDVSTGRAVAASTIASRRFLGMAEETKTGVSGGSVKCLVSWGYEALYNAVATLSNTHIGSNCVVSTDNDVTNLASISTAKQIRVGEVISFQSGDAWVALRNYTETDV